MQVLHYTEAVIQRCSVKKMFLEISQNSQKSICARDSFLIKLQVLGLRPVNFLKKSLWHRCFPVKFAKSLRTPFLQNTHGGCFWLYNYKLDTNMNTVEYFLGQLSRANLASSLEYSANLVQVIPFYFKWKLAIENLNKLKWQDIWGK